MKRSIISNLISCNYYVMDDKKNPILGADVGLGGGSHYTQLKVAADTL